MGTWKDGMLERWNIGMLERLLIEFFFIIPYPSRQAGIIPLFLYHNRKSAQWEQFIATLLEGGDLLQVYQ